MMNKKNFGALFCVMLILAAGLLTSCKDYDDDIAGLDDRVTGLEADVKALQGKLEDAIANGCWIEYYEIDQATGNCTLHFSGKEETLEIPSVQGKDATVRHFKVNDGIWQYAAGDGAYTDVLKASDNSPVKVTVNEDGMQEIGNIAAQTVETPDNGVMQVICIGDVQTTIRCDKNDPILAVDEENKYMLLGVGGVHYTLLLEGSSFKGLQSVAYRKSWAFDDYVEVMTLLGDKDKVVAVSQPALSFRVLPEDFMVDKAGFGFADVRPLKTRAGAPQLVYKSNSATLKDGILSLAFEPENMEEGVYYGGVLNVTLNGFTTTSDDFVVKKTRKKVDDAIVFTGEADGSKKVLDDENPLVFDDGAPYYLSNLNCGFVVGENDSPASLQDLGFDVTVEYELDDEGKANFTYGHDDKKGDYLAVKPNSDNKGKVKVVCRIPGTEEKLLEKTVQVEAKSLNIMLGAKEEEVDMAEISSLFKSAKYIELSQEPLNDIVTLEELFGTQTRIRLGYLQDDKLKTLDDTKVKLVKTDGEGKSGLFLYVEKQTDLDKITVSENKQKFDLYLMADNGSMYQVNTESDGRKYVYLKGVNFYYTPYVKPKKEFVDWIIFDNGWDKETPKDKIEDFPHSSIKGKAIVGRSHGEQQYSFEAISFSELYDWSPEDYVTFSISKDDQTDFLQKEWGKTFNYDVDNQTFGVKLPCNLRKLNFGNDQMAKKKADGATIPNTDATMKEKGGNEGLKIRYTLGNGKEVIDNWYFLDPISSPGDKWFYCHYRFDLAGADQVYCYAGSTASGEEIDILKCLTNKESLNAANAQKLDKFISNMAWDWYFDDLGDGTNNIVKVVNEDGVSKIVVSEAAKKKYGDITVTFDKTNKDDNFEFGNDYATSFKVRNKNDYDGKAQIKLKITTPFGEQQAMFNLKKR